MEHGRTIEVGMTVEKSGKFIVSVFDFMDPEDMKKKDRYQAWKRRQKKDDGDDANLKTSPGGLVTLGDSLNSKEPFGREELGLIFIFIIVFGLYVGTRLAFNEPENNRALL